MARGPHIHTHTKKKSREQKPKNKCNKGHGEEKRKEKREEEKEEKERESGKKMCEQFPRIRYVSPCGIGLCPFIEMVCGLVENFLFF